MLFGIPWFGIVAIVAIAGGLLYAYKERELQFEEKRISSAKEINEVRKVVHNLRSRIEALEAIVSSENSSNETGSDSLKNIEIDDENDRQINDNTGNLSSERN